MLLSQTEDMLKYAKNFYQNLFDPDPIDQRAVQILLDGIDDGPKLTEEDRSYLNSPISLTELSYKSKALQKAEVLV